jgi:hypothetical protein
VMDEAGERGARRGQHGVRWSGPGRRRDRRQNGKPDSGGNRHRE